MGFGEYIAAILVVVTGFAGSVAQITIHQTPPKLISPQSENQIPQSLLIESLATDPDLIGTESAFLASESGDLNGVVQAEATQSGLVVNLPPLIPSPTASAVFSPTIKPTPLPTPLPSPSPIPTLIESGPTMIPTPAPTATPSLTPSPSPTPKPNLISFLTNPIQTIISSISKKSLSSGKIFNLINQHRSKIGKPHFEKDEALCKLADERAPELDDEIFTTGKLHQGLYNRNLPFWITENMAHNNSEEEIMNWWLSSYIHKKAIESDYQQAVSELRSSAYKYSCGACLGKSCVQLFTSFEQKITQ